MDDDTIDYSPQALSQLPPAALQCKIDYCTARVKALVQLASISKSLKQAAPVASLDSEVHYDLYREGQKIKALSMAVALLEAGDAPRARAEAQAQAWRVKEAARAAAQKRQRIKAAAHQREIENAARERYWKLASRGR